MCVKMESLLHKLEITIKSGNNNRIQYLCNKLIELGYEGTDVRKVLVISYIKMKLFKLALLILDKLPNDEMIFEKAYCYYCLNEFHKAFEILNATKDKSDYKIIELLAQIYYNMNDYEKSLEMYKIMEENFKDDDNHNDRYTNILAVKAAASGVQFSANTPLIEIQNENEYHNDNYEYYFNISCLFLSQRKYILALNAIKQSQKYFMKVTNNQILTDLEKDDFAMIIIQMAYIQHKIGNHQQALQLLENDAVKHISKSDFNLRMVAENNRLAIYECLSGKDSIIWSKNITKIYEKTKKLTIPQYTIYLYNSYLSDIRTNHIQNNDTIMNSFSKLNQSNPNSSNRDLLLLIETNSYKPDNNEVCSIDRINEYIKQCKTMDIDVYLRLASYYREKGDILLELLSLKQFPFFYNSISLVIYVYKKEVKIGRIDDAICTLVKYASQNKDNAKTLIYVVIELMTLFIENNRLDNSAISMLRTICESLIGSYCYYYVVKIIEFFVNHIFSDENTNLINDTVTMENNDLIYIFTTIKQMIVDYNIQMATKQTIGNNNVDANGDIKKTKKSAKKTISELEQQKLDPERWLPKYERSNYKPDKKGKKNTKPQFRGAQGISDVNTTNTTYSPNHQTPSSLLSNLKATNSTSHISKVNKMRKKKRRH